MSYIPLREQKYSAVKNGQINYYSIANYKYKKYKPNVINIVMYLK